MADLPIDPVNPVEPTAPPRADAPNDPTIYQQRNLNPEVDAALQAEADAQLTPKQAWTTQITESSVAAKAGRFFNDVLTDFQTEDEQWDKSSNWAPLTADVPREFWEDIFDQPTLASAQRRKADIQKELSTKQVLGMQKGLSQAAVLAGSLVDLDAPLAFASGGSVFGAKVAGKAARLGAGATRAAVKGGAVAGLETGLVIGGGELAFGLTSDWVDAAAIALTAPAFGAAGGLLNKGAPEITAGLEARQNFLDDVRKGIYDWEEVPSMNAYVPGAWRDQPVAETIDGEAFDVPEFNPYASLSAAAPRQGPAVYPGLKDPLGRASDTDREWIQTSRKWAYNYDVKDKRSYVMNDLLGSVSTKPWFNLGTGDTMSLFKSEATMAHHAAAAIFDMPGGQLRAGGPANAAQLQNMYQRRIGGHYAEVDTLMNQWAQEQGQPLVNMFGKNYGASRKAQAEFNKRVMLDLNNAAMGRPRDPDSRIRLAAEAYNQAGKESGAIAKGMPGEIPLEGADRMNKDWYMPYRANGNKIAKYLIDKVFSQKELEDAVSASYLAAGSVLSKDIADIVAKAWVGRFVGRAAKIDDSMISVFSSDGREFLRESLKINGMSDQQIEGIMSRFDGEMNEAGKMSSLKHRNDLDFSTPIGNSGVSIVDLMRTDLDQVYTGYAREIAGQSALARHGITSKTKEKEYISALLTEQRMLGETPMDGNKLKAMFSTFHAGPEWGYSFGQTNEGVGVVSELKSLASLSALQLNVFAQAAETAVGIVASGISRSKGAHIWGRYVDDAFAASDKAKLKELGMFMGNIGQDHRTLRAHLSLDDSLEYQHGSTALNTAMTRVREFLDQANYVSGAVSGLNFVRSKQQETAVLGMMDRVVREIRDGNMDMFKDGGRLQRDLGLTEDLADRIKELIDNGTITWGKFNHKGEDFEYIDRLNLHDWPEDLAQDFAASLNRSMNQSVQHAVAGERDRWTYTTWGSMISHLQTFPLLAVQKQFFRNAMSKDREAALQAMFGVGMAYAALYVRDKVTGKERSAEDRAKAAFGYANVTGWMPMYSDPLMSAIGFDDMRFNQFGATSSPLQVPMVDILGSLWGAPQAATKFLTGQQMDYDDKQSVRAIPFFRLAESAARVASLGYIDPIAQRSKDAMEAKAKSTAKDDFLAKMREGKERAKANKTVVDPAIEQLELQAERESEALRAGNPPPSYFQ